MTGNEGDTYGGNTETMSGSSWSDLTYECLINILSRLTLEHRCLGPMLVCKSWLNACKDPSLYKIFNLETQFNSTTESSRWWTPNFERQIDSMLRSIVVYSYGNLTEIRTRHCSDFSINFVAERCPNLEVLWIKSCPSLTDASMVQIAFKCTKLRELDISYCYGISHESLVMLGRNCPNLKVLKRNLMNWLDPSQHGGTVPTDYLNACPLDGDSEANAIAKFMPHLEHLEVRFSKLSSKGLVSICEGCLNLEYLDISGCANLTSWDIVNMKASLRNLKEIKKSNFYVPRSDFHTERYGHWRLYDERFQTDAFRF
ncbi:F-box protein SKIP1 [Ricinus communis]|uniref:F-box/LRR-repeat protein, putative n=1 Tax=Ricinus communis TaxID=3988 RepID=B9STU0_RICCO|nr:F-box protein SKIP1 [Ricinus communis]EEF33005.1 F-box/LRR-repeat protein, putative [Ricinus communis]|eukprot:XP_002529409.1 F-box protein SKIP1 [Ricinus communis]